MTAPSRARFVRTVGFLFLALLFAPLIGSCGRGSDTQPTGSGASLSVPIPMDLLGIAPGTTEDLTANIIVDPGTSQERTVPMEVNSNNDTVQATIGGLTAGSHTFKVVFFIKGTEVASWTSPPTTITAGANTPLVIDPAQIRLTVPDRRLFYNASSMGLFTVDPANPTAVPGQVEPDTDTLAGTQSVQFGVWDSARQRIMGLHQRAVIYAKADGKVYKVSALKSDSPTPVQVSSETGVTATVCSSMVAPDFANFNNSIFVYRYSVDTDCTTTIDNTQRLVRLGMATTDAPITVSPNTLQPLTPLRNKATGAITGWLAINGTSLFHCDPNFNCDASALTTFTTTATRVDNDFFGLSGLVVLRIDNTLRVYNVASSALTVSLATLTAPGTFASDGINLYFTDGGAIKKLPISATGAPSTLLTVPGGETLNGIQLTDSAVVFQTTDSGSPATNRLRAISKGGGTPTLLLETTSGLSINAVAGHLVYYLLSGTIVGSIKDDGTGKTEIPNANFAGVVFSPSSLLNSGPASPQLFGSSNGPLLRVLWMEGCTSSTCANGTLKSADAPSNSSVLTLGSVPADRESILIDARNEDAIASGLHSTGFLSFEFDIFFVKVTQADSLVRVTNTSGSSEFPVGCATVFPVHGKPGGPGRSGILQALVGMVLILWIRRVWNRLQRAALRPS